MRHIWCYIFRLDHYSRLRRIISIRWVGKKRGKKQKYFPFLCVLILNFVPSPLSLTFNSHSRLESYWTFTLICIVERIRNKLLCRKQNHFTRKLLAYYCLGSVLHQTKPNHTATLFLIVVQFFPQRSHSNVRFSNKPRHQMKVVAFFSIGFFLLFEK